MSIPPLNANARSSIEIKDSCDCCDHSSCWPRKKARHVRKAKGSTDLRIVEVSKANVRK